MKKGDTIEIKGVDTKDKEYLIGKHGIIISHGEYTKTSFISIEHLEEKESKELLISFEVKKEKKVTPIVFIKINN